MKRPAGVIVTVVLLALGGLLYFSAAAFFAYAAARTMDRQTAQPLLNVTVIFLIIVGYGIWAFVSALGVWKLRPWARMSLLVLTGCMVIVVTVMALSLVFVPMIGRTGRVPSVLKLLRFGVTCFALVQITLGALWYGYFSQPTIKGLFSRGQETNSEPGLPVSVAIVACQLLHASLLYLTIGVNGERIAYMGALLEGWLASAIFVLVASISGFVGLALLKLHPRALTWGLWFLSINIVYALTMWVSGPDQIIEEALESGKLEQLWLTRIISLGAHVAALVILLAKKRAYLDAAQSSVTTAPQSMTF